MGQYRVTAAQHFARGGERVHNVLPPLRITRPRGLAAQHSRQVRFEKPNQTAPNEVDQLVRRLLGQLSLGDRLITIA